jgi:hypothetical protein
MRESLALYINHAIYSLLQVVSTAFLADLLMQKKMFEKKPRLSSLFRRGFHYIAVRKKTKAFLPV